MSPLWQQYHQPPPRLPQQQFVWPFAGQGLAGLGVNGKPVLAALPACGPDEIVVRVDALGLCASDAKMVRMGQDYPLFATRDFAHHPARLGHEAALTVVAVGAEWQAQHYPGQRLGIQPDVYVAGEREIFGVNLAGAMAQYAILDRRVLASDSGSCVFPVPLGVSYADVALLEPWACVDVAYSPTARRLAPKPGGVLWISGAAAGDRDYHFSSLPERGQIVLSDVAPELAEQIRQQRPDTVIRTAATPAAIMAEFAPQGLDDIVLLEAPGTVAVAAAVACLAPYGTLNLVTDKALDAGVAVDMNQLHYGRLALLGCTGPDISAAYGQARNRAELRAGGVTWIVGAGGAMGRMHLQRALEMADGPRAIIVTNRGEARLDRLVADFGPLAEARGRQLVAISPTAQPARLAAEIAELTNGRGCDDIVAIVPSAVAIENALPFLAQDGMLVFFAGVAAGNQIALPLDWTARYGAQFTGTSGSTVADQLRVLDKIQQGALSAAQAVAAIGGLHAMHAGLQAVIEQRYPGKIVIYPQLDDLPLLSLAELDSRLPAVYAKLGPGQTWNAAAERVLIEQCWRGDCD